MTATNFEPQEAPEVEEADYSYEDDYCPCWCEMCGCHGVCMGDDDWDEEDYKELVDSQTE